MPTKREQVRAQKAQAQKARNTQIAIIVGALVVIVAAFWAFSPKRANEPVATVEPAAATAETGGQAPQVTSKQYSAAPEMTIVSTCDALVCTTRAEASPLPTSSTIARATSRSPR